MARLTQKNKVMIVWIKMQLRDPSRWIYPYDVINAYGTFIGYKAPTRFVEICTEFPALIETKMDGKYRIGRLRLQNVNQAIKTLPPDLVDVVVQELMNTPYLNVDRF